MAPKIPTRTDAVCECACGGTMTIATVAPIPDKADHMRHVYHCNDCDADATFDVAKKATELAKDSAKQTAGDAPLT